MTQRKQILKLNDADPDAVKHAYDYCHSVAKKAAGNFYYAFIFLPKKRRRGIEALYAFCRIGDDLADDEPESERGGSRKEMLTALSERLDLCYDGMYCDLITLALADAVKEFGFEKVHFDELLKGIEMDLEISRYQTFDELKVYCYRVASTVGLLCLKVFGCDNQRTRNYAETVGIGMQLTNILRDIHEDFERGRIYLPQEDLQRFGLNEENLFEQGKQVHLKELVAMEIVRAGDFYIKAEESLSAEDRKSIYAARIMASIYRELLKRISISESFDHRIELTIPEKINIGRRVFRQSLGF